MAGRLTRAIARFAPEPNAWPAPYPFGSAQAGYRHLMGPVRAPQRVRVLTGFAVFGVFWGGWGAALPLVRQHAGVDDGQSPPVLGAPVSVSYAAWPGARLRSRDRRAPAGDRRA